MMGRPGSGLALWLGLGSAGLLLLFEVLYSIVLILGLAALEGASEPIRDPFFTAMEILILLMMPSMVVLSSAIYQTCNEDRRVFGVAAVAFAAILTTVTASVHAAVLFLSRTSAFDSMAHVFSFEWPSVVYVLDVLAWDYFFALFAASLAFSLERSGIEGWARRVLLLSALLAFAGLWGAATNDMNFRNIGILGYVPVFTIAVALIGVRFAQRLKRG